MKYRTLLYINIVLLFAVGFLAYRLYSVPEDPCETLMCCESFEMEDSVILDYVELHDKINQ